MAKLSGPEILRQIGLGNIVIDPFDPSKMGPNSYDLHLGNKLLVYNLSGGPYGRHGGRRPPGVAYADIPDGVRCLDSKKDNPTIELEIPDEGFDLIPGVLYLGNTVEYTETPHHVPYIDGRSSFGRLGLQVHLTAGAGDVLFCGRWTLELTVVHPLRVYKNSRVCQISYVEVVGEKKPYSGKYQNQDGPTPSASWKDFHSGNQ